MDINNQESYSFVVLPPTGKNSRSIRVPVWICKLAILMVAVFTLLIIVSIYISIKFSVDHKKLKQLQTATIEQQKKIEIYDKKMDDIAFRLEVLLDQEQDIVKLLGKSKRRKKSKKRSSRKTRKLKKKYKKISNKFSKQLRDVYALTQPKENTKKIRRRSSRKRKLAKKKEKMEVVIEKVKVTHNEDYKKLLNIALNEKIALFTSEVTNLELNLNRHFNKVNLYKARFANTPSTWPTYGRILSRYGRRRHPLTRKWHYHKGIDIPAWNGAPIKATADGIVIYAGWANTFGNLVTIRHGMGYMTMYAHASRVLVRKGESVKKGQIVAQVGSSGLSTGPHIHYEINRWGKSVNPVSYLDLDMFTASRKMW